MIPEIIPDLSYVIIIGSFGMIQAVAVAIIAGLFSRESKKRKAENDKHEKQSTLRTESNLHVMQLMSAVTSLACATGSALKDEGRVNGKMDAALDEAKNAQREYYGFVNRIASSQMAAD